LGKKKHGKCEAKLKMEKKKSKAGRKEV